jgi:hypothetical protein
VAAANDISQQFEQHVDLAGWHIAVFLGHEPRVQAQLTQQRERLQDGEPVGVVVVLGEQA